MENNHKNPPWRVVFFGTSDFPSPSLEALRADKDFEITLVVTQPDKPVGRSKQLMAPPVKRAALQMGLSVWQPESLKTAEAEDRLKKENADAFIVAAYGKILPQRLLDIPRMGCVNIHGSLLPLYRGASPVSAAIAAGEKETGVTIMKMDAKMDEGPIMATQRTPINDDDTTETLMGRLAELGAALLGPTLKLYLAGELTPKPQNSELATYTKILSREDGRIDWDRSAEEIERFVRAMKPWPEAWTMWKRGLKEVKLVLKAVSVMSATHKCDTEGRTGVVCSLSGRQLGVNCGTGSISIERLQLEGKAETDAASFMNGYSDFVGAKL